MTENLSDKKYDVFISYSSQDKSIADTIAASFERVNIRCWYAPRDIQPGMDWAKATIYGIRNSSTMVLIFSSHADHSQHVLDEVNFAISEEKPIIPFRVENLEPSGALRLHLSSRQRLVKMRSMTHNRLHSVVHRNNLVPPEGGFFADKNRSWRESLSLLPVEKLQTCQNLAMLYCLESLIAEVNQELARISTTKPWSEHAPYLLQLPGFGLINTMIVFSAIGDIHRFPTSKKLVGYAGLGGSVHDSGQLHYTGPITKQGRKELRWALVEAAWLAVEHHPFWKQEFHKLNHRMKTNKAIVVIAHRLLVTIWHVMSKRVADRKADPEMVAFKLMKWSWQLNDWQHVGLSTCQLVHYQLMHLKLGENLSHIKRAHQISIAPVDEILALKPELRPIE